MNKNLIITQSIKNNIELGKKVLNNENILITIEKITKEVINAFKHDKKAFFCGNGGSAADAQHLAAELSGKFYLDREPLFAEALHVNSSYLTAVANDYSYDEVYARLIKGKGREGDILIAISTSGNSQNIIKAIKIANDIKMITVGLTGKDGGMMNDMCKYLIKVPSSDTPRIQELHILIGHIICEIVEKKLFL